ncbi:MAG: hypothetical protein JSV25_11225, partial [Spirochaetota bacterium]
MRIKPKGVATYLFLFLSLCILFLAGYGIVRLGYHGIEKLFPSLQYDINRQRVYISSYLSHLTRSKIAHDSLVVLEKEKSRLARTQRELDELETSMESFLESMKEKQEVFEANVSSINIGELVTDFRAATHINKYNELFNSELNKRKRLFFKSYTSKKTILVNEKQLHEKSISELSHYIDAVQRKGSEELEVTGNLPYLNETQKLYAERAVIFIKQGEYERAAAVLKTVMDAGFDDQVLLIKLLSTLEELERRQTELTIENPLVDLKLSYLTEDYEEALDQTEKLESDPFLRPLLSTLNTALYRNIEITDDIDADITFRNDVKGLINMATRLEQIGEYEKAVNLYRKLLLLDIPPHDREYLTSKLYSAMKLSIVGELKRSDNTRAIKLLENARRLIWEGKKDEALNQFLLLIKECPNSDYVGQAVG